MRATTFALTAVLLGAGCTQLQTTVAAGYAQLAIDGNVALSASGGSLSGTTSQDIDASFGLGDAVGSPYVNVDLDFGVPVISVSGFTFEERGTGTLSAQFGNLTAGTNVESKLRFSNVKAAIAFQVDLGPVAIGPGVAIDVVDLDLTVRDTAGFSTEDIQVQAPVPMAYLRGDVDLGALKGVAELGYIQVPTVNDVEGTFWDAEVRAELRLSPVLHLFAGYRMLHVDGEGTVDDQSFATDLDVGGWMIGGGVRF
jgi:hypothetical protein